jgi:hypothetical protein
MRIGSGHLAAFSAFIVHSAGYIYSASCGNTFIRDQLLEQIDNRAFQKCPRRPTSSRGPGEMKGRKKETRKGKKNKNKKHSITCVRVVTDAEAEERS